MVILKWRIPVMFLSFSVVCSELSVVSAQTGIGLVVVPDSSEYVCHLSDVLYSYLIILEIGLDSVTISCIGKAF